MSADKNLIDRLKERGEEVFSQISGQLMANPQFVKAMEHAFRGKETMGRAVGHALKQMNRDDRAGRGRRRVPVYWAPAVTQAPVGTSDSVRPLARANDHTSSIAG